MDLIPSFSVDHTKIVPGIFTSRVDVLSARVVPGNRNHLSADAGNAVNVG